MNSFDTVQVNRLYCSYLFFNTRMFGMVMQVCQFLRISVTYCVLHPFVRPKLKILANWNSWLLEEI